MLSFVSSGTSTGYGVDASHDVEMHHMHISRTQGNQYLYVGVAQTEDSEKHVHGITHGSNSRCRASCRDSSGHSANDAAEHAS